MQKGKRGLQPARGVRRLAAPRGGPRREGSAGGMMRLETLIELKYSQFELFEFIPLLNLDKLFPVEQFEATVSQSTAPSPPPKGALQGRRLLPPQAPHRRRRGAQGEPLVKRYLSNACVLQKWRIM